MILACIYVCWLQEQSTTLQILFQALLLFFKEAEVGVLRRLIISRDIFPLLRVCLPEHDFRRVASDMISQRRLL